MSFGSILKCLRNEKGINQTELGRLINVGKTTISGYENDSSFPDKETLKKIADYFDVSIDYLLGRTNDRTSNKTTEDWPADAIVLMRSVSKLTDKQKEIVKRLVQEFIDED